MVWVASLFRQHILDLSHRCACFPGSWLAGENIMVFPRPHRVLLALEVARKSVSTVSQDGGMYVLFAVIDPRGRRQNN